MSIDAIAVIDAQIEDCIATGHTGCVENLAAARGELVKLIEAAKVAREWITEYQSPTRPARQTLADLSRALACVGGE